MPKSRIWNQSAGESNLPSKPPHCWPSLLPDGTSRGTELAGYLAGGHQEPHHGGFLVKFHFLLKAGTLVKKQRQMTGPRVGTEVREGGGPVC